LIARLLGTLVDRGAGWGIVDVQGVGYEIFSPTQALEHWAAAEQPITVHVATQVREDAITLYGFALRVDREAFRTLLSVSGIGPKTALATLDTFDVDGLARAVAQDDVLALAKISGVGKKSAQRMALELKGKLSVNFVATGTATGKQAPTDMLPLALARLEYGKSEIDRAMTALAAQGMTIETSLQERLGAALRVLSGN